MFCVIGIPSVEGVSAAATSVDVTRPTSYLSKSEPITTVTGTRPGTGITDRLTRTAPGAITHPLTGRFLSVNPIHPWRCFQKAFLCCIAIGNVFAGQSC